MKTTMPESKEGRSFPTWPRWAYITSHNRWRHSLRRVRVYILPHPSSMALPGRVLYACGKINGTNKHVYSSTTPAVWELGDNFSVWYQYTLVIGEEDTKDTRAVFIHTVLLFNGVQLPVYPCVTVCVCSQTGVSLSVGFIFNMVVILCNF